MTTAKDIVKLARTFKGYREAPGKKTPFGAWYGANGQPWCAMFVSYVINHAGGGRLIKGAQTAKGFSSCGAGIAFFKKKKAWYPAKEAQKGDLVFFDWDLDGLQDHVGIVISNNPTTKTLKTIEGNISGTNPANGGGVDVRVRPYKNVLGVGRPAYDKEPDEVA